MNSKEYILSKIRDNLADKSDLPDLNIFKDGPTDLLKQFKEVLQSIGGHFQEVSTQNEIISYIEYHFSKLKRIVNKSKYIENYAEKLDLHSDPHSLANLDLLLIDGQFGVAENGSIWITDLNMGQRVAPFITQYLAIILKKTDLVANMHQAYDKIGQADFGFGTFLAGPSKTADIEQSLVLGAHGARDLVVFLID